MLYILFSCTHYQVWEYIKTNNLQNPEKKKEIICDAHVEAVFGQKKAQITEVMKLIGPHVKKIDAAK